MILSSRFLSSSSSPLISAVHTKGGAHPPSAGDRVEPGRSADQAAPGPGPANAELLHQPAHAPGEHAAARKRRQLGRLRGLLAVSVPPAGARLQRPRQGDRDEAAVSGEARRRKEEHTGGHGVQKWSEL